MKGCDSMVKAKYSLVFMKPMNNAAIEPMLAFLGKKGYEPVYVADITPFTGVLYVDKPLDELTMNIIKQGPLTKSVEIIDSI